MLEIRKSLLELTCSLTYYYQIGSYCTISKNASKLPKKTFHLNLEKEFMHSLHTHFNMFLTKML